MDAVLNIIESFKSKLTDQEYIDLMDALKIYFDSKNENSIPEKIHTNHGKTITVSNLSTRGFQLINFDIDGKNIATLNVPTSDLISENEYEFQAELDDDITITASDNGWDIITRDNSYERAKLDPLPNGTYGYQICDKDGNKHSIMNMPSEVWYRCDGSLLIEKWHYKGKLLKEKES